MQIRETCILFGDLRRRVSYFKATAAQHTKRPKAAQRWQCCAASDKRGSDKEMGMSGECLRIRGESFFSTSFHNSDICKLACSGGFT